MTKHAKNNLKNKLLKVALLLPAMANTAANLFSAARFEVAAIRKRLLILFILAVFCCILLTISWICVNALLVIYLQSLNLSLTCSITATLIFNLFVLITVCLLMAVLKIDTSFLKHNK